MKCTWSECEDQGLYVELDRDNKPWANLCAPHHAELETAIGSMDAKALLRSWLRAQGGARKAAERMMK